MSQFLGGFPFYFFFNTRNKVSPAKLLRQGYRYHKLRKAFSTFYRRHFDIVSKYDVGLKTLLLQGLAEPKFYGDLVYKFREIIGKHDFPYHFKMIIVRYKKIGYNINVKRQTACLVVNPIKVNPFRVVLGWAYRGLTCVFLLLQNFSVAIAVSPHVCLS